MNPNEGIYITEEQARAVQARFSGQVTSVLLITEGVYMQKAHFWLRPGWRTPDHEHTVDAYTQKAALAALAAVVPCSCFHCSKAPPGSL